MEIQNLPAFLDYFDRVHRRTVRVARCIPPGKLEWSFRAGKFTCGDLARHIAAANRYIFAEGVQNKPIRYAGCGRELADGFDAVLAFMDRLHGECVEIFSGLSASDLNGKCKTPDGASITVWKWLRSMIEHEIHHRGQIYIYLSLLEISTPPLYGLTSERVRELSVQA